MWNATEKHKWVRAVKSKPKALRQFKVDPVLKLDETVYKHPESIRDYTRYFNWSSCKIGNARFTAVPLNTFIWSIMWNILLLIWVKKCLFLMISLCYTCSHFCRDPTLDIICFLRFKHLYIIYTWSDKPCESGIAIFA